MSEAVAVRTETWEPKMVALVCNWCTYAGADSAGTARRVYAPNVRIVRFLCTGRLDPVFVVKAFENGADGVIASGCHPADCHYVQGNYLARRRLALFTSLMDFLGLDRRRLHLAWVSASEGVKWAKVVDEATAAVREAGPLGRWAAPSLSGWVPPELPLPEAEPRTPPSAEETARLTAELREAAAELLAGGEVSVVLGYAEGSLPGQTVPAFVRDAADVERLVWNERCANNLTVYLREALRRRPDGGRVGIVAKSCDAKTLNGFLRENQIAREDVVLIGVSCEGVWAGGDLAAKCYACAEAIAPGADRTIGEAPADRAVAPDPRDAQVAALDALPANERWEYWQRQFELCIRCYACRAVCPLCYCDTCVAEKNRPQWVRTTHDGQGNTAWNVVRAMHLAGRCVGCDECARACPADVRLDLLNRKIALELEQRYAFTSDAGVEVPAPLTTFRPDDPGEEFL